MNRILAALASGLISSSALASPDPVFDVARVSRDIQTLSSDAYEGRAPATRGETKTIAYIAAQMRAAGLQPAGDAGSWYQNAPLLMSEIIGSPALTLEMAGIDRPLVQGEQIVVRAALNGKHAVAIDAAPLVFVGYGVNAPERHWDDFKGVDLRGKIMVVLVNDPDFEGGEGDFGGRLMTYYGRWTYKYEEAARRGAVGVLIVHEDAAATYSWQTVRNSYSGPLFDIVRKDPFASHVAMEGWVRRDFAEDLFKASGLDFVAAKALARRADFRPIALPARLSAHYANAVKTVISHNVAGVLQGSKHSEETVLYTAHWDHLGICAPTAPVDRICNGAVDNASGVAALLELARAHASAGKPDRSVLFLALTAEEKGLLGSEYYAANPLRPLASTVGVINMDPPFGAGQTRDFSIIGVAKLDLLTMLTAIAAHQGRAYSPDPEVEAGYFFRGDHFPFAKRGVPAISFDAGQDLVVGGRAAGKTAADAYKRDRYHQTADKFDPHWNSSGVQGDLSLLYGLGRELAEGRMWPNWSPDSAFRGLRDITAGQRR
jgi:Zn-dependent M28 family amino/carboxypeptidase